MTETATAQPTKNQAWISAMRPRTLPLALASIGMGAFLAAAHDAFSAAITLFCILTTIFLQILSNLANDYGDSIHGADSADRAGPARAVQSGMITPHEMRRAMLICALLAMISGVILVWLAFGSERLPLLLLFLVLGAIATGAAVTYTAGYRPYGYAGLGDVSVFLFFGLLGVVGAYFLQTQTFVWSIILPAASCGVFATAVLNINNIRDIQSDRQAGKYSIPVRLGERNARLYHWLLLAAGFGGALLYVLLNNNSVWQWLFILTAPLLLRNALGVWRTPSTKLDPLLKQMVLTSLLFVITFGVGQLL